LNAAKGAIKDELQSKSHAVGKCAVCLTSENKLKFSGSVNVTVSATGLLEIFEATGSAFQTEV